MSAPAVAMVEPHQQPDEVASQEMVEEMAPADSVVNNSLSCSLENY